MAFPSTGILDNFNRANEGPPPSINWTNVPGLTGLKVVNQKLVADDDSAPTEAAYWSASQFSENSECYIQVSTISSDTFAIGLFIGYDFVNGSGYAVKYFPNTGVYPQGYTQIVRGDNWIETELSNTIHVLTTDDWLGIERIGSYINVYVSTDGTNWTQIDSVQDGTYITSGNIGVAIADTEWELDNFGGGDSSCSFVYTDNTGSNDTRPFTFLSLPRYAQILGLNPIQFFGANSAVVSNRHCDDTWFEYVYQDSGKAARYEILLAIAQAEEELIRQVGYLPAPYWVADEKQDYPQFYQKEYSTSYGYKSTGLHKSVTTDLKYVICGGIRATTQITDFVYCNDIDTDGDGFYDTAVFQVNGVDFDTCQLKAYIKEYAVGDEENCRTDMSSVGADPAWELRDTQIRYNATTETALVYIKKWLLFKPQLQQAFDAEIIDADDANSYVDTVEFWRVYNDSETQVQFLWSNDRSCASVACAWATQTGCFRVQNSRQGIIVPQPGTYANGVYSVTGFSQGVEPTKVRLWYYAGYQDANARGCDKLNQQWARIIAMLATARIAKPICSCENLVRKVSLWQEDVSLTNDVRSFNINPADLSNPFGTKLGEILAYNALKNFGMKVGKRIITY